MDNTDYVERSERETATNQSIKRRDPGGADALETLGGIDHPGGHRSSGRLKTIREEAMTFQQLRIVYNRRARFPTIDCTDRSRLGAVFLKNCRKFVRFVRFLDFFRFVDLFNLLICSNLKT